MSRSLRWIKQPQKMSRQPNGATKLGVAQANAMDGTISCVYDGTELLVEKSAPALELKLWGITWLERLAERRTAVRCEFPFSCHSKPLLDGHACSKQLGKRCPSLAVIRVRRPEAGRFKHHVRPASQGTSAPLIRSCAHRRLAKGEAPCDAIARRVPPAWFRSTRPEVRKRRFARTQAPP